MKKHLMNAEEIKICEHLKKFNKEEVIERYIEKGRAYKKSFTTVLFSLTGVCLFLIICILVLIGILYTSVDLTLDLAQTVKNCELI